RCRRRSAASHELQLQIGAFQDSRASLYHFIQGAIDVAMLKLNSAAAIEDDARVQSEVPSIQHAVFDAIVQRQAHEVDVLDRSLLQIISKNAFTTMRVLVSLACVSDAVNTTARPSSLWYQQ